MGSRHSEEAVGLCTRCRHMEVVGSAKGSRFYLCRLSSVDAGFPKYPRLPVMHCRGFERVVGGTDGHELRKKP